MDDDTRQVAERIPVVEFEPDGVAELDLYQKREKIYTRQIKGFYQRLRSITGWPLLMGYLLLPWINWNGQQMVLFDLPARQFRIVGWTFWPQDFPLLAGVLIMAAFALFMVTSWLGRVWCGYTCPQTVWTAVYMWAEQFCEGSRNQRIKRDRGPWSIDKVLRKTLKHAMWLGFALLTGLTFVGYFVPMRSLSSDLLFFNLQFWGQDFWSSSWILFFTAATYINAGWLREQICIYMCPYARFQGVMFDSDTLVVSYDSGRGEPRGARKRGKQSVGDGMGNCVDCQICVQVCPTGIDIRNGLQYECIDCALCIDACDSVMKQMEYPPGLISYTTENVLAGGIPKHIHMKVLAYGVVLLLITSVVLATLINRIPLRLDVIRDRDRLYAESVDGDIENNYLLKIINMGQVAETYQLTVDGLKGVEIIGKDRVSLPAGEIAELQLRLRVAPQDLPVQYNSINFTVTEEGDSSVTASAESRFIGPAKH